MFNFQLKKGLTHREDRILLTHDVDFLDDERFPPHRNPGVVVLPGAEGVESTLIRALWQTLSLVGNLREAYRKSKVVVHKNGNIVIISRDYGTGKMTKQTYRFAKHGPPETLVV